MHRQAIHILAIIIFTLLSYANTFDVPFQLDDIDNIVNSPAIKKIDYFKDISSLDRSDNPDVFDKPLFKTRYFGYLTFALNYAVHGLDVRGYHLVNSAIHLCAALLVYYLVILTFRTPRFMPSVGDPATTSGSCAFIALFASLLFAVHPVQTQAVTYIVQRFASLATMLWLVSLVCYVAFRLSSGPATGWFKRAALFSASLVSAVLAMKTKEFALLLPLVIILYEFMFLDGTLKKRFQYLLPLCLTMVVVPLSLMNGGDSGLGVSAAKISGSYGGISRLDYLFTQFRVIVTYLRLLLFPVRQAFDYDYPIYHSFFISEVFLSFLLLAAIFLAGIYSFRLSCNPARKNRSLFRLASFGIFWFFITIAAESSIIPIADVIFEHRLYLPSIGFFLALVSAIELLRIRWAECSSAVLRITLYAMLLLTTGLSVAAYSRNSVWRDRVGFQEDEVLKSPNKARPRNTLAGMYAEQGRMAEAVYQFKTVIAVNPGYADAHYSLGATYARMGLLEDAVQEYKNTIALRFDHADAHNNLGAAYAKMGHLDEAVREYTTSIMIFPQSEKARNNLANTFVMQGRRQEALQEYQAALRIKPDFAEAHYNLGSTFADMGRVDEAKNEFREALRLKPDFVEARWKLGMGSKSYLH